MKQLQLLIKQSIKIKVISWKNIFSYIFEYIILLFKTAERKDKIAVCYLGDNIDAYHTNFDQQTIFVNLMRSRGYIVDLFKNGDLVYSRKNHYQIIFGFGESWRLLCKKNSNSIKILYCTEAPPFLSFINEYKAISRFETLGFLDQKVKKSNRSYRFYRDEDYCEADYVLQMGPRNCKALTQTNIIKPSNLFEIGSYGLGRQKSRQKTKKSNTFLWFGSRGVIHKGLDLVLKYFIDNQQLNLIVAGCSREEFLSLAAPISNIKYAGIVDVESSLFDEIMDEASFCILPSASEGLSTAVITCMYQGIIPIVTRETNINGPHIIWIEPTIESLDNGVKNAINIEEPEYLNISESIRIFSLKIYNQDQYRNDLNSAVASIGI